MDGSRAVPQGIGAVASALRMPSPIELEHSLVRELPDVVARYQSAHDRSDTDAALTTFSPDAVVSDDGQAYRGHGEIRDWLARASVEFTYTRTLIDAEALNPHTWLVTNHLEGDFPGGVVDLRYRFVLDSGLIAELEIAP